MANFCAKCGTGVSSEQQFCLACGAPIAAGTQGATAGQSTAMPDSGRNVVKIVLIVVAVCVGLGIFGYTVWRVAHAVHSSSQGGRVTVQTPDGIVTARTSGTFSAADLGTEIYPGAQLSQDSTKMKLSTGSMVTATFVTQDSKDQVEGFYRAKLGGTATTIDTRDGAILTVNKGAQETVMVTITSKSLQNGGKTQIHYLHTINDRP